MYLNNAAMPCIVINTKSLQRLKYMYYGGTAKRARWVRLVLMNKCMHKKMLRRRTATNSFIQPPGPWTYSIDTAGEFLALLIAAAAPIFLSTRVKGALGTRAQNGSSFFSFPSLGRVARPHYFDGDSLYFVNLGINALNLGLESRKELCSKKFKIFYLKNI